MKKSSADPMLNGNCWIYELLNNPGVQNLFELLYALFSNMVLHPAHPQSPSKKQRPYKNLAQFFSHFFFRSHVLFGVQSLIIETYAG